MKNAVRMLAYRRHFCVSQACEERAGSNRSRRRRRQLCIAQLVRGLFEKTAVQMHGCSKQFRYSLLFLGRQRTVLFKRSLPYRSFLLLSEDPGDLIYSIRQHLDKFIDGILILDVYDPGGSVLNDQYS